MEAQLASRGPKWKNGFRRYAECSENSSEYPLVSTLSGMETPLLDQIGAPMAVRQDRLDHSEAQTTMGYTHAVKADERRAANELGKILHGTARKEQEERPALNP